MISLTNPIARLWPSKLRSQLIVGVAVVHLLLMTVFVSDLVTRQRDFLREQSLEQTKSLAQTLAINSSSWVLANDVVGLEEIVLAVAQYPDLRYVMVVDSSGKVLAHTDKSHVGQYLDDEKSRGLLAAEPKMQILHAGPDLLDIAMPIVASHGKEVGWARIGQGLVKIEDNINVISRDGIFYTLLAIVVGSLFAVLLGRRLTAGLNRLLDVSRQIEKGSRDLRAEVSRHDEIALLGAGLNKMLDALAADERLLLLNQQRLGSLADIFQFQAAGRQELFDYAMKQALLLTGSGMGFIADYDPQKGEMALVSWSREVMKQCAVEGAQFCFHLDGSGLLGEAARRQRPVLVNDYQAENPLKKGCPQGHVVLKNFLAIPVLQQGQVVAVAAVANNEEGYDQGDITQLTLMMDAVWRFVERKQAERDLEQAVSEWSAAMDAFDDIIYLLDLERRLVRANKAFYLALETTPEIAMGRRIDTIMHPQGNNGFCPICRAQEEQRDLQVIIEADDPHNPVGGRPLEVTVKIIRDQQGQPVSIFTSLHDLSVARREVDEKAALEKQLQQAQKMELVGRLAGGVAHDFNNMLGVILGYTDMALTRVDPTQPLYGYLGEIQKAGQHSADLTRQLLAFARQQAVVRRVLHLNETVEGMLKMLQRLIGENIVLDWRPGANLWAVKMDPAQIDQILANLCVNARDSITGVGRLSIATSNVVVDSTLSAACPDSRPGEYVLLTVGDSGCGMDKETLAHIFEPFYTTKKVGEGTGLGLATIDGAVHQNDGFVCVDSAPGQGTTFTIYLPRHVEPQMEEKSVTGEAQTVKGRGETVLLVEDEPVLLQMTTMMLEELGYIVMAAGTPDEAFRLAREHSQEIQLLLTDVVMPEMSGRDLTERLLALHPHLKSLYMSGYTADIIAEQGILEEKVNFLQKPFSLEDMAEKVREALDRE